MVADHIQQQIEWLNQQIELLHKQRRYEQAIDTAYQTSDLIRRHLGEEHQYYARSLTMMGWLYEEAGDHEEAERLYKQELEVLRKAVGEEHPDYATALNNLAGVYRRLGRY